MPYALFPMPHSLLTIPMLAEFLEVPVATVRLWYRRGLIIPEKNVHNLAYFDFQEVLTAKALRDLRREGLSARGLENRLKRIQHLFPDIERPLAQLAAIAEGKDILLRKENRLIDHKGQTRFDFANLDFPPEQRSPERSPESASDGQGWEPLQCLDTILDLSGLNAETLCEAALVLESEGDLHGALNTYRAALFAGGPDAEICFQIAGLLHRLGDLTAARERYYMALEINEEYVEARASLGCLLAESGDWELAISAFQGALTYHPDYAEVHYHLGTVLWEHDRKEEARQHFEMSFRLQPDMRSEGREVRDEE